MATFKSNDNVRVAVKDNGKWKLIWVKESDLENLSDDCKIQEDTNTVWDEEMECWREMSMADFGIYEGMDGLLYDEDSEPLTDQWD